MPLASSQASVSARSQPRPPGEEDDLVVGSESLHDRHALRMRRVVDGRGEEGVPVLRASLDVVQAVPDVGDDAVDVDDRQWPGVLTDCHDHGVIGRSTGSPSTNRSRCSW